MSNTDEQTVSPAAQAALAKLEALADRYTTDIANAEIGVEAARNHAKLRRAAELFGSMWARDMVNARAIRQMTSARDDHEVSLVLSDAMSSLPTEANTGTGVEATAKREAAPQLAHRLHTILLATLREADRS